MFSFEKQALHQRAARWVPAGLALALIAAAPAAYGLNKCVDDKGAITFQEAACPPKRRTPAEEEALQKEIERQAQEKERAAADAAKKKAEMAAKIKERDKAYQEKMSQGAEERKKAEEMEARILQGTSREGAATAGSSLPAGFDTIYPAPWKEEINSGIVASLAKAKVNCGQSRHRQRTGGAEEYLVQCTKDGAKWETYFVWPATQAVKGPIK